MDFVSCGRSKVLCRAGSSLLCLPPGHFIVLQKYRCHLKGARPRWCVGVPQWGMTCLWHPLIYTLSFLLCPLCEASNVVPLSNKAMFRCCLVLQGKPDRRGYLPVRKAALLGVQSGAAAMCWVSFTPSFARRSMFGVLKTQSTSSGLIQRVFNGMGMKKNIFYLGKFLLFEDGHFWILF